MKKMNILVAVLLITLISGCGKPQEEVETITAPTIEESESIEKVEIPLTVYGGNEASDGLITTQVMVAEITPEIILEELTKMGNITNDTKVRGFLVIEKENGDVIDINLSEEFEVALSKMGSSGEYIALASFVNTFLEAYQANSLVLHIAGVPLETGHNIYEDPFVEFPMDVKLESKGYELIATVLEGEGGTINYPQIVSDNGEDETFQKWNDFLKKVAVGDYTTVDRVSYEVGYQVMTEEVDTISILFEGEYLYENAPYPVKFASTVNIDLVSDSSKRLSNYADIDKIITSLTSGIGYQVVSEDITNEIFNNYLSTNEISDLPITIFDYDYNIENDFLLPEGYSYIKNNRPVLVMNVPHALGDYIEIEFE